MPGGTTGNDSQSFSGQRITIAAKVDRAMDTGNRSGGNGGVGNSGTRAGSIDSREEDPGSVGGAQGTGCDSAVSWAKGRNCGAVAEVTGASSGDLITGAKDSIDWANGSSGVGSASNGPMTGASGSIDMAGSSWGMAATEDGSSRADWVGAVAGGSRAQGRGGIADFSGVGWASPGQRATDVGAGAWGQLGRGSSSTDVIGRCGARVVIGDGSGGTGGVGSSGAWGRSGGSGGTGGDTGTTGAVGSGAQGTISSGTGRSREGVSGAGCRSRAWMASGASRTAAADSRGGNGAQGIMAGSSNGACRGTEACMTS